MRRLWTASWYSGYLCASLRRRGAQTSHSKPDLKRARAHANTRVRRRPPAPQPSKQLEFGSWGRRAGHALHLQDFAAVRR